MNLGFDLKYAWRLSKKSWGYTLTCTGVVALSVALAIFSYAMTYRGIFKPLGFPGSERWYSVQIAADAAALARPSVDAYTHQELLALNRSADYLGAYANRTVILSEGQTSTTLRAAAITPRLLAATRVASLLGRTFDQADARRGSAAVAILSFNTWQTYFAAAPDIIGRTARIDAAPVRIIGVMPKDLFAFEDFEVWLPLQMQPIATPRDSTMTLTPFIVLGANQNLDTIRNEMKAAVDGVNGRYPDLFNSNRHVALIPAARMFSHGDVAIQAMASFMSVAVLLLGAVNISMLFFARLLERSRELALRTALGASRPRLLRQCLLEASLVLPPGLLAGYGLGSMMLRWGDSLMSFATRILATGRPTNTADLRPIDIMTAVMCVIAIWLFSTLIPAWRISRQDPVLVLAGSGKGSSRRGGNKSAALLVGMEVITSCLVLVACGSLVLAIRKELSKPTGLNTANVMMTTYPTVFDLRYSEPSRRLRYWEELTAAIESRMPGTEVAFSTAVPTKPLKVTASIETQQGADRDGTLKLPVAVVSDNYFALMGLRLRSGRLFDGTDSSESLKTAIVDEKMAARYWPDKDVLGKRVQLKNGPWLTIVGIVSAVEGRPYSRDTGVLYQPLRQAVPPEFLLLVRLPNTAADSRRALRSAAFAVDRDLPLRNLQMFDDYVTALNLGYTSVTKAFTAAAFLTVLLAASGLFGLISRSVAQRTHEVGVRRALGARPWQATSMFVRQGALYLSVSIVGVGLGLMLANVLSASVTNVFDNVFPVTFGVVLLMAGVIFLASYLPGRHALALEPGDALHYE